MSLADLSQASVRPVQLSCPTCRHGLAPGNGFVACQQCDRSFEVVDGIPDLRLSYQDPYLSLEEDRRQARELVARFDETDFAGLLRHLWKLAGKPPELTERFLAGDLAAVARSKAYLAEIERARDRRLGPADRLLEVGCGTAALAAVAVEQAGEVVASDVSLRWLVLARKRLAESGAKGVRLVCCAAEDLPFADGSMDVIAASDVVEHLASQEGFVRDCHRVLRPGGTLFLATPNRFSLGLEPHVRLWGVGLLPRPLAKRYVLAARKAPYEHVRLLSARGLRRLLGGAGFEVTISAPEVPAGSRDLYSGLELRLVRSYNRLRRLRPVHSLLLLVGPFFHVFAVKQTQQADTSSEQGS